MAIDPIFGDPLSGHGAGPGFDPRATRIPVEHRSDITTELWIGGSYSAVGERLPESDLRNAWLVDCAGELPETFRASAAAHFMRVFEDLEDVPQLYPRIQSLSRQLAATLSGRPTTGPEPPLPAQRPDRVYVLCKQGLNRSALLAGRILRELGAPGEWIVDEIRRRRPGSLSNETFVRLIQD